MFPEVSLASQTRVDSASIDLGEESKRLFMKSHPKILRSVGNEACVLYHGAGIWRDTWNTAACLPQPGGHPMAKSSGAATGTAADTQNGQFLSHSVL